jgi:hypothetical protein
MIARKRIIAALRFRIEQLRLQRRHRFRDATNDPGTIMIRGFSPAAIRAGKLEPDTMILIIGRT